MIAARSDGRSRPRELSPGLADHIDGYISVYNEIRPHEALDFKLPIERYTKPPPITLAPAIQIAPRS